jgi:acetylglutamate kinase
MEDKIRQANILIESLPYIRRFYGKTIVVKYGGHAMVDEFLKGIFAKDIVLLKYVGINIIIVHGGGPQIGDLLKQLNIPSTFVNGLRITDNKTMDVVEMVLSGKINKDIVNLVNKAGGKAVGLSGKDGPILHVKKMVLKSRDGTDSGASGVDLGQVGEIVQVDVNLINKLQDQYIPIISPVGVDEHYETYNINADTVAGYIAGALHAEKLVLLTDVAGILDEGGTLISSLSLNELKEIKIKSFIKEGMLPKIDAIIYAMDAGVQKAHIINGKIPHSLLLEVFTDTGIGTQIIPNRESL